MEGFNDLLEEIRKQGGQLMWITQKKNFLENTHGQRRSPEQIKQEVLQSARLRHCTEQLLAKTPELTRDSIQAEAKSILDEMAHLFDLKYVRMLGYVLIKVFSRIYKHIYYNSDICSNLQVLKHYPTIFLPLHRSYMDFLLVSIICFHKNIQLPTIATGQDFLGLSYLSQMIRHSGAFFIRRSFGSDQLYWAIFNEYVQQHLLNADRPLEFFIEGMRSRTSKSLRPKQGMLASCLELYLNSHRVEDIYLVPISLTYERLLEETLYSNELLGIPKPKESVSGLVKARTILNQSFGTIFCNFARPISVREMLHRLSGPHLTRTLTPSFVFELNSEQQKAVESLSFLALIEMQRQQIIQPVSLIATCVLDAAQHVVSLEQLSSQAATLKRMLNNLGAKVYWPLDSSGENDALRVKRLCLDQIKAHSNLFQFDASSFEDALLSSDKCWISVRHSSDLMTRASLFENASIYLAVCSYKNQLVNFLVRVSFVCNCLLANANLNKLTSNSASLEMYKFLTLLFNREFIFREQDVLKDYHEALSYLVHTNLVKQHGENDFELVRFNLNQFLFLVNLFGPVQANYLEIYSTLAKLNSTKLVFDNEKKLVELVQERIFKSLMNKEISNDYDVLSLNLISNGVLALRQFNLMTKLNEMNLFEIDTLKMKETIIARLAHLIENNRLMLKELTSLNELSFENELRSSRKENLSKL